MAEVDWFNFPVDGAPPGRTLVTPNAPVTNVCQNWQRGAGGSRSAEQLHQRRAVASPIRTILLVVDLGLRRNSQGAINRRDQILWLHRPIGWIGGDLVARAVHLSA